MDCKQFREWATAAADEQLNEEEKRAFVEHTARCSACRNAFEVEVFTKRIVRSRVAMVKAPASLTAAIAGSLRDETARPSDVFGRLLGFLGSPVFLKPALAFAVGCIAMLLLLRGPDTDENLRRVDVNPGNVIQQSLDNYLSVANQQIQAPVIAIDPESLGNFFTAKTGFPVLVPQMQQYKVVGGAVNEYAGVSLAHIVYKHLDEVVYLYQTRWQDVQKGEKVNLPQEVSDELLRTGVYSYQQPDGYSVVLWTKGRTLCSVVAHLPKQELLTLLATEKGVGVNTR